MSLTIQFLSAYRSGAALLVLISFTIYRKSHYYRKAQAEASGSAEEKGKGGWIVTVGILLFMVGFLVLFDLWIRPQVGGFFHILAGCTLLLVLFLSAFDAFFIDSFLLIVWRPRILRLPDGFPTVESMRRHVALQFSKGWIFKVPIALTAAVIAAFLP